MHSTFCLIFLIGTVFADFPEMAPLSLPGFNNMNFGAMQFQKIGQGQSQKQASQASTGDVSADFGTANSNQNSGSITNDNGVQSNAGSNSGCSGGNCALNGAAQLTAGDQSQSQSQALNQNLSGSKLGFLGLGLSFPEGQLQFPVINNHLSNQNANIQKQKQVQTQIGGAANGVGSVTLGNVSSVQNTVGETNKNGGSVLSTNVGNAIGTGANLNGATQAKLQGQEAEQLSGQSGNQNADNNLQGVNRPGCATLQGNQNSQNNKTVAKQKQTQNTGDAAAAGQGTAAEGSVNSAQQSSVNSNKEGVVSSSGSLGNASGKGIHLSGAASSSGSHATQQQANIAGSGSNSQNVACV
jgi:hypothetical protein